MCHVISIHNKKLQSHNMDKPVSCCCTHPSASSAPCQDMNASSDPWLDMNGDSSIPIFNAYKAFDVRSFIDNLLGDTKNFWNFQILFHKFFTINSVKQRWSEKCLKLKGSYLSKCILKWKVSILSQTNPPNCKYFHFHPPPANHW